MGDNKNIAPDELPADFDPNKAPDELPANFVGGTVKKKEPTPEEKGVQSTNGSATVSGQQSGSGGEDKLPKITLGEESLRGGVAKSDVIEKPKMEAAMLLEQQQRGQFKIDESARIKKGITKKIDAANKSAKEQSIKASIVNYLQKLTNHFGGTVAQEGEPTGEPADIDVDIYEPIRLQTESLQPDMVSENVDPQLRERVVMKNSKIAKSATDEFNVAKPYIEGVTKLSQVKQKLGQAQAEYDAATKVVKEQRAAIDDDLKRARALNPEKLNELGFTEGFEKSLEQTTISNTIADMYIMGDDDKVKNSLESLYADSVLFPQEETAGGMIGGMIGGQVKPLAVGFGLGALNPALGVVGGSAYYGRMNMGSSMIEAYTTARAQGMDADDAYEIATKQAKVGFATGAAEGLVGMVTMGGKPVQSAVTETFKRAVKSSLKEAGVDGAIAGGLKAVENVSMQKLGLDVETDSGVMQEMAAEALFGTAMHMAMFGGKKALGANYGTIINGIASMPFNEIQAKVNEAVKAGVLDAAKGERFLTEVRVSSEAQEKLKGVDIPEKKRDTVIELQKEINQTEKDLENASPAVAPALEKKIEDLSAEMQVEAAIPLTAKEKTELNKLQTARDENKDYDKDRLKVLEKRQEAAEKVAQEKLEAEEKAKEETIKRQQEQKAAEEQAVEPKPEVTTTQVVETPAETVSEAVVEQPKSEVSTVSGEGVSGSALKDVEVDKKRALQNAEKIDKGNGNHVNNMSMQELKELAIDMEANEKKYQDKFDDAQGIYNLTTERIEELEQASAPSTEAPKSKATVKPKKETQTVTESQATPLQAEAESKAITEPSEGVRNFEAALNERTDKKRDKALKNFGDKEADARGLIEDYDANIEKLKAQGIEPTGTKAEVLADMLSGKYDEQLAKQSAAKEPTKQPSSQESMVGKTVTFEHAGSEKSGVVKSVDAKGNLQIDGIGKNKGVVFNIKPKDAQVDVGATKISEAKKQLDSALKELGDLTDLSKLGAKSIDPEKQAEAMYKVHKALVNLAKQYIAKGITDIKKFAKQVGVSARNAKQAWDEAMGIASYTKDNIDYDLADIAKVAIRRGINVREKLEKYKAKQKDISLAIKEFMDDAEIKGALNTTQLKALVKRAASVTNDAQFDKFIDYAEKVIKEVNYAEDMAELKNAAKQVRKGKHGRFTQMVKEFASIDAELLTEANLDKYKEAIDALNQKVPSYDKMAEYYNEIMTDIDSQADTYSNIKTFNDASKKFADISSQSVNTVDDYRALSRNISALKNRLKNLLADGDITQQEYTDIVDEIESKTASVGHRLATEIDALKAQQIKDIKSTPLDRSQLTPQENAILDRLNQLSVDDLKELSVGDLDVLSEAVKRVEQGFVPMQKVTDIVVKAEASKFAPKIVEELNNATKTDVAKAGLTRDMKLNEAAFISRIIGAKEGGAIDKYIINPVVRAITQFRKDVNTSNEKWLNAKKKAFGTFTLGSTKKKTMNKLGLVFNMLQNSNGDAPADWIILSGNQKEIDKYVSKFEASKQDKVRAKIKQEQNLLEGDKAKAKMIREQYNELLSKFDAGDGTIDLAKLKAAVENGTAFTESEKILFDVIVDIDSDLKVKQQAANEIQGKEFGAVEYHSKRIPLGRDTEIETKVEAIKPAMRAGSGKSRTDEMPRAIETDIEKILVGSIEETNKDYYMLNATKYANEVAGEASRQGNFTNNALNAIRDNIQARINSEFAKSQTSIGNKILAARMASSLIDIGRAGVETATAFVYTPLRAGNLKGYATFFNPSQRSVAHKLISDTNSSLGLKRLNKQLEAGTEVNSKNLLVRIGEKIMTFPEHATLDMAWMPTFETAFKEITGEDFDAKKYETDKSYRDNYNQAILDAATEADVAAKQIVGGGLKFEGRQFIRILPKFAENIGMKTMVDANTYPGKIAGFFGTYTARESKEFFDGFTKAYKGAVKGDVGEVGKGGGKILATAIGAVGYGVGMGLYNALWTKMTSDDEEQKAKAKAVIDGYYTWDGWAKETAAQLSFLGTSRYGAVGRFLTLMGISSAYNLTDSKEEKAKIEDFSKNQLFTKPLDFSGNWYKQASNYKTLSKLEPYFAYAAEKIIDAGEGIKGYFELADMVNEKGFESLTQDEKQKFVAGELFLNTINMMLMFKGTQVPMTPKIEQYIRDNKNRINESQENTSKKPQKARPL